MQQRRCIFEKPKLGIQNHNDTSKWDFKAAEDSKGGGGGIFKTVSKAAILHSIKISV